MSGWREVPPCGCPSWHVEGGGGHASSRALRRLVVDWIWPECMWSCPHYDRYVPTETKGPGFAQTQADMRRDRGKLDRLLGDLLGLRGALEVRLRELQEQISDNACHEATGFDLTGDYPEGNHMTRFLGHLIHRDAALRYFWGVYTKLNGVHTWSKVTLKQTQAFLKWVTRHIVCEHGRAYMLDKAPHGSPIHIPRQAHIPPPVYINRDRHVDYSGWYKYDHYRRLINACCDTWGKLLACYKLHVGPWSTA